MSCVDKFHIEQLISQVRLDTYQNDVTADHETNIFSDADREVNQTFAIHWRPCQNKDLRPGIKKILLLEISVMSSCNADAFTQSA